MSAILNTRVYLAQVEAGRFLVRIDTGRSELEITDFPSVAWHGAYPEVEQTVQRLRRRGFRQAVVTNALGEPVSARDLRAALSVERAASTTTKPLPQTLAELKKIPASEERRRRKTEPDFDRRASELYAKEAR